jgi:hypothetical protein
MAGEVRRPDAPTAARPAEDEPEAPALTDTDEASVVAEPPGTAPGNKKLDGKPTDDKLTDLYKQCESAAQRGDCAEAKRVLERINRSDRGYRARAAKVPAMAKCLAQ